MKVSQFSKAICISAMVMTLTACETLMTRSDVREVEQKRQMQDQVVSLQRTTADVNNRFADIESDLRSFNGRLEVVENRVSQSGNEREKLRSMTEQSNAENSKRILILQEDLVKMQEQMGALVSEINSLKSALASSAAATAQAQAVAEKPAAAKDLFEQAEEFFDKKEWRKAILNYQKFRDANPKSKKFAEATYKMGVSFQEIGMKDEARTFFDEVISKYPNSGEAKKAKTRLKSLKK